MAQSAVLILFFISFTNFLSVALSSIDQSGVMNNASIFSTPLSFREFLKTVLTPSWLLNFTLMGLRCSCFFQPILLHSVTSGFAPSDCIRQIFVRLLSESKNYQIRFPVFLFCYRLDHSLEFLGTHN